MKVIRCKDCALANDLQCPLNYIDKQRMIITERSPMFFCGKAQATEQYEPTYGDNIRNMTDAQLAELLYQKEKEGYDMHGYEGKNFSWANIKKLYQAYVRTPDGEDIEVEPIRHGHWGPDYEGYVQCSVCNEPEENGIFFNRCPSCGAIMDGGDKHDMD